MTIKILKLLTVLSFLIITFSTEHIGGQFGLYIILGLFSGGIGTLKALFYVMIILLIILSNIVSFSKKIDFAIFTISGIFFCIPIIMHISYLISKMKNRGDTVFYITTSIFLVFYIATLFKIKENNKVLFSKTA